MKETNIKRTIYYFDFYILKENPETHKFEKDINSTVINQFFDEFYIAQKQANSLKEFIIFISNTEDMLLLIDYIDDEIVNYKIVLCRKDALPYIEKDGILESLGNYIEDNQNIAEVTHCVFFRKYGIIGAEYNSSGARAGAITTYMSRKGYEGYSYYCKPKVNMDSYNKLISGKEFSLFDLSVKSDSDAYTKMLSQKSIFKTIVTTIPESDTFEIILRKRKLKKNFNKGFQPPLTTDEIRTLLENFREDINKFSVSQEYIGNPIDLLSDKLINKIVVVGNNKSRTVNSEEYYNKIKEFFFNTVVSYCK